MIKHVILVMLLVFPLSANSATIFVDATPAEDCTGNYNPTTKDCDGSGSYDSYDTLDEACSVAVAGDTVYVRVGTYTESVDLDNSGSIGLPITYQNYNDEEVLLDANSATDKTVHWNQDGNPKHYIIWDGIDVTGSTGRGIWIHGDHNTVQNCKVYGNGNTGIQTVEADYTLITKNEVYGNGWNGISFEYASNNEISYNYIHDNDSHAGVNGFPAVGSEAQDSNVVKFNFVLDNDTGMYFLYQTNFLIYGNIIAKCHKDGIFFNAGGNVIAIHQNTIYGNGTSEYGYGINNGTATNVTAYNNIIYDNYNGATNGTITVSDNLTTDPTVVSAVGNDFTLDTGSNAIDAGGDLGSSYSDGLDPDSSWPDSVTLLDQDSHGDGWEIGAFVYEDAAPAPTVGISTGSGTISAGSGSIAAQ